MNGEGRRKNLPRSRFPPCLCVSIVFIRATFRFALDYMHLVRWNGEWKIIHSPWDMLPRFKK